MHGHVVDALELSADEQHLWREYCSANADLDSPFFAHAYIRQVAEQRGGVKVACVYSGDRPVAFFPYQFSSQAQSMLAGAEPVGGHMTDAVGLVAAPGFDISPRRLLRLSRLHHFLFTHLPESQKQFGLAAERLEPGLAVDLSMGLENYWRALHAGRKDFVRDLERRQRRVVDAHGPLRFEFSVAEPAGELRRLIDRKREQYETTGVGDALAKPWTQALLFGLAAEKDRDCAGVLSTLYAGETWLASHFGLRGQSALHYWFPVYNAALKEFSPGHLLFREVIAEAPAQGITYIRRGTGTQPWKELFSNAETMYYRGAWWRSSLQSAATRLAISVAWRFSLVSAKDHH